MFIHVSIYQKFVRLLRLIPNLPNSQFTLDPPAQRLRSYRTARYNKSNQNEYQLRPQEGAL